MSRLTKKSIVRENGYVVDNPTVERCAKAIDKLGELEDAEENGLLVRLPIPLGTTLYQVWVKKIYKLKLFSYSLIEIHGQRILQWSLHNSQGFNGGGNVDEFGKTVFLTREEAEQALKEREDNE